MAQFVGFLLFLVFAQDAFQGYSDKLGAPLEWIYNILLVPTPIKVRVFDLILVVILLTARKRPPLVGQMRGTLLLVVGSTVVSYVYGIAHGGEFRFASWQTYLILSSVLLAFTIASVFRTTAHFTALAKWLLAASFYHGAMCWISYFTWGRSSVGQSGAYLTSHDDTISWVVSILILIVNAIDKRTTRVVIRNGALALFFLGAIQFNNRRLAWVSLAMGLAVLYVLFPPGPAKRRVNRLALMLVPVLVVYAVVGWGREGAIFMPLQALSSVSTQEDTSTLARNAENLGLITTANSTGAMFGTGWGRPYIYLTMKYDISAAFELWQYVPHNSLLGVLAFSGVLGFIGFWLPVPASVFLNARVARVAADPRARSAAIIGVSQLVVCANQLYGDMGIFFLKPMYVIAVSYAMALRLPAITGVLGKPTVKAPLPVREA